MSVDLPKRSVQNEPCGVLWTDVSRKSAFSEEISAVNLMLGCTVLNIRPP